ncbi:MAG: alpha/beta fold hydrolase [Xanthomonadales bacterium]|nr:alpha/beta fold hydrolase [Xanthomonadales bacterium]
MTLLVFFVVHLEGRPDLHPWHLAELDAEFTTDSEVASFEEYLVLEDRLFRQLEERVYAETGSVGEDFVNRFKSGSLSDPSRWSPNWNRTFEWPAESPRATVLLLHGLSDSPYSLRALGQRLQAEGHHVLGLRIPGHGTAPSGLVTVRWQDMAAAVRLAVEHLRRRHPGVPLHIVGYSNGAALAVHHALIAIDDPAIPQADRLVLLSPEIGITSVAAFAVWQGRLGYLLGLDKLAWNSIHPEYDPFKYNSFAINAADLSYRITAEIQRLLGRHVEAGTIGHMPPILAFTSAVDATVRAPDLVAHLFNRLEPGGHELVVYDINHKAGIQSLLRWSPAEMTALLEQGAGRGFTLSLVTNDHEHGNAVHLRRWAQDQSGRAEAPLGLEWPEDVFSLTHVALPFPPGDPLYGAEPSRPSPGIQLGNIAMHGERGVLQVSPAAMLRLRWNPFYDWQEDQILRFLGQANPMAESSQEPAHTD